MAQLAVLAHLRGHTVRAENDALARRNLVHAVNENCPFLLQFLDDEAVVNDLFADVDRRAKRLERNANNIDGSHHPGAKSPRLQ
jgi:hypothetical protein